ncbi:hypothetical protein, conserved [Leishmania lindenbergi]|uniref:Uncharacterized protein n=1 Tax=Leishmania lindenbergi TaxID=651832 RepID=A0AAW2ZYV7_9TRYP
MQSTTASWETMSDSAARARVLRLRQSAAPLQDVYGAFSPWQHLSTSLPGLDSLLSVAGVCEGVSGSDDRSGVESTIGGLPVGGLHELYGPPLSGKSWLLRRVGAAYVRRMTAYRQWYHDELERVSKRAVEATLFTRKTDNEAHAAKDDEDVDSEAEDAHICANSASPSPITAMEEWDLYVCLVRGAGADSKTHGLTASPPSPSLLSPDVRSWLKELVAPFDSSSTLDRQVESIVTGPVHGYSSSHQQQHRDYAEQHIHFRVVHSPNELLAFLECLGGGAASVPSTSTVFANTTYSAAPPVPRVALQQQLLPSQLARGSLTTAMRGQKQHRSPGTTMSSSPSFPLTCGSLPQCTWRLQRQRLLLLDGLDALWLHPSLGNHSATHTGQWFAEELHRQLRTVLLPRLGYAASDSTLLTAPSSTAAAAPMSPHPQHVLYSTVVFTNGCHGSSRGFLTAQQLEARLAGPAGGVEGWAATLPRPSGNAAWCRAVDTRCLIEPAHLGLVSILTPSFSYVRPAMAPHESSAMYQNGRRITGTFRQSTANYLESLVTVVKGGSRVAATWVLRNAADGEQEA